MNLAYLRGFQGFWNWKCGAFGLSQENKGKKLPIGKVTMAEIKRTCKYDDYFTAELFEQEYV